MAGDDTIRASCSNLDILEHCGYYLRPDAPFVEDKPQPKTRAGSAVHWCNEMAVRGELYTPDDAIEKFRVTPAFIDFVQLTHLRWLEWWRDVGNPRFQTEVAYEYDTEWQTVHRLLLASPRGYPYRTGCVYGTADTVTTAGGRLIVTDLKTGNPAFYGEPRKTKQMLFLGMCAARLAGASEVVLRLQFADPEAIKNRDNVVSAAELAAFEEWLCARYATIRAAEAAPGFHCSERFCKLRPRKGVALCPAWAKEIAA